MSTFFRQSQRRHGSPARWPGASRALLALILLAAAPGAFAVEFHSNDRVVFLGNTFADRLRLHSYLETSLLLYYPKLNLTFRDLGWPADEVALRPRPLNFGDIHQHLGEQKADVIFLFYGANESFKGKDGLEKFTQEYEALIREVLGHQYNGRSAPRVVLVSPIPQERLERQPDVTKRNEAIALYADAIKNLASANELGYVDLFSGFSMLFKSTEPGRLTFNGVHLTARGDFMLAELMLTELRVRPANPVIQLDLAAGSAQSDIGSVELLKHSTQDATFRIQSAVCNALPRPESSGETLQSQNPLFRVLGLNPGIYELKEKGQAYHKNTAAELAKGIYFYVPLPINPYEDIRARVVRKNRLFFDRWRAVNGYYIYGDRKEPFGAVSFPPEMKRFDELIAQEEAEIHKLCDQPWERTYELVRVGDE